VRSEKAAQNTGKMGETLTQSSTCSTDVMQ
jgi:hypothetical protein